jgi:hypothetical protein
MAPTFSFPLSGSAAIETLDGSNWATWSACIIALLRMNGLKSHITDAKPTNADKDWLDKDELIHGVLDMYCLKDVWTAMSDETKFATSKAKWDELKRLYGEVGSMASFNTWVALNNTALDDSSPMLSQLQKLNDARVTLGNNDTAITDLQFCFILLKALPNPIPWSRRLS